MESLYIVSCGKSKIWDRNPMAGPSRARDVYVGPFASKCRRYAERVSPQSWCILSAKYGFLLPHDIVPGPYNVSFNDRRANPISLEKLALQLKARGLYRYKHVVVLGGRHYTGMVKELFPAARIEEPLCGCPNIGSMLKRLNELLRQEGGRE